MPIDELPQPVPGRDLAELRRKCGVKQSDIASRLGIHRVTLNGWENAPYLDGIRAVRYRKALEDAVAEATGAVA